MLAYTSHLLLVDRYVKRALAASHCCCSVLAGVPAPDAQDAGPRRARRHGDAQARVAVPRGQSRFLRDGGKAATSSSAIVEEFPTTRSCRGPSSTPASRRSRRASSPTPTRSCAKAHRRERRSGPDRARRAVPRHREELRRRSGECAHAARESERAIENDDERTEYLAARRVRDRAAASARSRRCPCSISCIARVTPTERALIVARCRGARRGARPQHARAAVRRARRSQGSGDRPRSAAGSSIVYERAGDAARAARCARTWRRSARAVGLPRTITEAEVGRSTSGGGDRGPRRCGRAARQQEGESRRRGAVAGLGLAAGAPDGKGVVAIETRAADRQDDVGRGRRRARAAERDRDRRSDRRTRRSMAPVARAESLGVPLISLSTSAEQRTTGRFVFHMRHSPEARARALAQRALAKGIKTFAVLAPETDVRQGHLRGVRRGGQAGRRHDRHDGHVSRRRTKSFAEEASASSRAAGTRCSSPTRRQRLGLIAPALAAAGNVPKPQPWPKKLPQRPPDPAAVDRRGSRRELPRRRRPPLRGRAARAGLLSRRTRRRAEAVHRSVRRRVRPRSPEPPRPTRTTPRSSPPPRAAAVARGSPRRSRTGAARRRHRRDPVRRGSSARPIPASSTRSSRRPAACSRSASRSSVTPRPSA